MFSRALLVALCIVYATTLTPLAVPGDDDCALYLTGPGRSSAYDYSLNLLKGNFAYDGQHTCITYEAINQAYLDARQRILVSQPKGDWKAEDFASVGELVLDISINLARTYGLTYEEIEKGLPLIDTSRTLIREVCPPVFSHVECRAGKYRRLDGLCNNLVNPTWGATMAPFQRLIGPLFSDGINAPRISHTGHDLPLSRVVSRTMHPDEGFHDHAGTVMVIAWGQFMDHDYTLTGTPLDPIHRNDPEECCKRPPHLKHPYCNEIRIPDDDYFYRLFGVKCIDFVRGFPSPRPGCRLGSRVPFNTLTGAIDGNTVYGVTEKFSRKLRTGYGGLLRMNPVFKEYGLKDLLPLKLDIPDEGCTRPNKNMFCFEAGEIRVNEQLVLTVMHTLMAREHNRVAEALALVNPHWDDETLFQEARRINIAEIQHITYNEFLPILLGKDVMEKFGLVLEKEGYWNGYDQNVNPDVIAGFAAAAYRFGHSLLPTAVERWSKAHKFIASKRLSDLIRRPYDLYRAGVLDEYVMGLMNQVAQAMDDSITQEVTNHLFKKVGARFGMDLVSLNMQRGREFGLPGYMEFRKFCGLSGADSFQDLFGSMANETIRKYESIFEHPIDVDLWSGGVSERPLPGSMLGPTFACIIATQFSYSRRGDRFWFELPNQPSSFSPEQLVEIRKARLARIICDNTDIIDTVQLYPMVLPDHELNPRVPCRSGIIPSMDFSKWAEPTPFGGAKEYMTDAYVCNQTIEDTKATEHETNEDCTVNESLNLGQEISINKEAIIVEISNDTAQEKNKLISSDNKINDNSDDCTHDNKNLDKQGTDKVLKYIYKKVDSDTYNKTKGHAKNSLKRKKRSLLSGTENYGHRRPQRFQLSDHQTEREELAETPEKSHEFIKNSDLADFNIETLHENIKPTIDILLQDKQKLPNQYTEDYNDKKYQSDEVESNEFRDNRKKEYNQNSQKTKKDNNEYDEKEDFLIRDQPKNQNQNYEKDIKNKPYDSTEDIENSSREYSEDDKKDISEKNKDESYESFERNKVIIRNNESDKSSEDTKKYINENSNEREILLNKETIENIPHKRDQGNEDLNKRYEIEESSEYDNKKENVGESNEHKLRDSKEHREREKIIDTESFEKMLPTSEDSINNDEFQKDRHSKDDRNSKETNSESIENFDDSENNKGLNKEELAFNNNNNHSTKEKEIDDFSYESINGKKEPINKDFIETNNDKKSLAESSPNFQNTLEKPDTLTNSKDSLNVDVVDTTNEKQVNINDDEIKPVIELNNEDNSSQSEEESKEYKESGENESSEEYSKNTLKNTGGKDLVKTSKPLKDDVKSQFERIPEDYKHTEIESEKTEKTPSLKNSNEEGTLDILTPDNHDYDKDLNIKFSDISIKLPEIKLPKDILAYTREEGKDDDEDPRKKSEETEEEQDDEEEDKNNYEYNEDPNYNKKSKENKDNFYQFYTYPQNEDEDSSKETPKQKDRYFNYDDNNEDLYEKFVRERFGKTGNLKSRAEKLINYEPIMKNKNLYKSVQKVLKRTNQIEKDAKNNNDPNYMWTLEYGGKL